MQDSLAMYVRGVDVSTILDQRLHEVQVNLCLLMRSVSHLSKMLDQCPVAVDDHADVEEAAAVLPDDVCSDKVVVDVIQANTTHLGLVIIILTQQTS